MEGVALARRKVGAKARGPPVSPLCYNSNCHSGYSWCIFWTITCFTVNWTFHKLQIGECSLSRRWLSFAWSLVVPWQRRTRFTVLLSFWMIYSNIEESSVSIGKCDRACQARPRWNDNFAVNPGQRLRGRVYVPLTYQRKQWFRACGGCAAGAARVEPFAGI